MVPEPGLCGWAEGWGPLNVLAAEAVGAVGNPRAVDGWPGISNGCGEVRGRALWWSGDFHTRSASIAWRGLLRRLGCVQSETPLRSPVGSEGASTGPVPMLIRPF